MISDSWEGSYETDLSVKRTIDSHIQETLTFIQKHEEQLLGIKPYDFKCSEFVKLQFKKEK